MIFYLNKHIVCKVVIKFLKIRSIKIIIRSFHNINGVKDMDHVNIIIRELVYKK